MGDNAIEGRDELLQRYRAGERDFTGTELDKQVLDLRDATLEGADFSRSFITADFAGANLKCVLFVNANLKTCDFSNADLRDAIFSGAALDATIFTGANLQGAEFEGAYCYSRMLTAGEKPWW
jgi:uncharacterized protein YjbI with pentapeptide repeats